MIRARRRWLSLCSSLVLAACGSSSAGPAPLDAGADAKGDSSTDVASDAPDGAGSHAPCAFNRECPAAERCACDETAGCACELGPRGDGVRGVDACASGDDCASSVCLEGPGGAYVCSGECEGDGDCGGALPICSDVALVGKICVRAP